MKLSTHLSTEIYEDQSQNLLKFNDLYTVSTDSTTTRYKDQLLIVVDRSGEFDPYAKI